MMEPYEHVAQGVVLGLARAGQLYELPVTCAQLVERATHGGQTDAAVALVLGPDFVIEQTPSRDVGLRVGDTYQRTWCRSALRAERAAWRVR